MTMEESRENFKPKIDLFKELNFQTIEDAVKQSYAEILAGIKKERDVFPTKWKTFNRQLNGGLSPGKLYVIGGRPGVGKSMFSNQLLFDVLDNDMIKENKLIVLYWTFEMPGYQQILRIGSAKTAVSTFDLLSVEKTLDDVNYQTYIRMMEKYKKYPIYFKNNAQNLKYVETVIKRLHEEYPDKIILNVFDHSRLFLKNKEQSELEMLTELSHLCIHLQQETKCINILLSQLNRNIEKPERMEQQFQPMLSDLFGADSLGQDAEVVIMLNRPHDLYNITKPYLGEDPKNLLAVHLEKNRNGNIGFIPFETDMKFFKLNERE